MSTAALIALVWAVSAVAMAAAWAYSMRVSNVGYVDVAWAALMALAALLAGAGLRGIHTRAARFEHRFTADALMAISLEVGVAGRRIGSVAPAEADACLARLSARLHALPEEERTFGPEIVWGIAHA